MENIFYPPNERQSRSFLRKVNKPAKRGFLLPVGIEYTFHAKDYQASAKISRKIKEEMERGKLRRNMTTWQWLARSRRMAYHTKTLFYHKKYNGYGFNVYDDCGHVVEITSPVHKSMRSLKNFYNTTLSLAKKYHIKPYSKTRGSGGAHVNVSIPRNKDITFSLKFLHNLMTDIGNRPYLNWIFNEPTDNHTANCMWSSAPFRRMYNVNMGIEPSTEALNADRVTVFNTWSKPRDINGFGDPVSYGINTKQYAVRCGKYSFELRFIDMFRDQQDLEDVLAFVEAYVEYIYFVTCLGGIFEKDPRIEFLEQPINLLVSIIKVKDLSFFLGDDYGNKPFTTAEMDFDQLLRDIGLDHQRYTRFCRRNLDERVKLGSVYFT